MQKKYKTVKKRLDLPDEMIKVLDRYALDNKISLNQTVIQCLKFALDNLDNDKEE